MLGTFLYLCAVFGYFIVFVCGLAVVGAYGASTDNFAMATSGFLGAFLAAMGLFTYLIHS